MEKNNSAITKGPLVANDYHRWLKDYEAALSWIVATTKGSPVGRGKIYLEALRKLVSLSRNGTPAKYENAGFYADLLRYLPDIARLIAIHQSRRTQNCTKVFTDKLSKLLGGSASPLDESTGNSIARDTVFELLVSGWFSRVGWEPSGATSDPDADVCLVRKGLMILIECKRVKSAKKLQVRLNSAVKQVETRIGSRTDRPSNCVGLVCLDVSRLVHDGGKVLVGKAKDMPLVLDREIAKLSSQLKLPSRLSTASLGFIIYTDTVAFLEESRMILTTDLKVVFSNKKCTRQDVLGDLAIRLQ